MSGIVGTPEFRVQVQTPRRSFRRSSILFLVIALIATTATGLAQEPAHDKGARLRDEELLDRLERAELKIQKLEAQVQASAALGTTLLPASYEESAAPTPDPMRAPQPPHASPLSVDSECQTAAPRTLQSLMDSCSHLPIKIGGVIH